MGIIKFVGYATEFCTTVALDNVAKGLVKPTGSKILDKVVIPLGIFGIECYVTSCVTEHIVSDLEDIKKSIDSVRKNKKDDLNMEELADSVKYQTEKIFESSTAQMLNDAFDKALAGEITKEEYEEMMDAVKDELVRQKEVREQELNDLIKKYNDQFGKKED